MATKFNIQSAARNRLRDKTSPPAPKSGSPVRDRTRPYGEVSPGSGPVSGRHWSGERQMARDNAMSRKWSQYKNATTR